MTVLINGQELVNHNNNKSLTLETRKNSTNECDIPGLTDITWEGGITFNLKGLSGELKGLLEVRDGDGVDYKGIPYYVNKLNEFVRTLAVSFNNGTNLAGKKIDGVIGHKDAFTSDGKTGVLLFSYIKQDGTLNEDTNINYKSDINIFNICLSKEVQESSSNLAVLPTKDTNKESDNSVINGFSSLFSNRSLFREGGIYQFVNSLSSTLAIDKSQATNFQDYYSDIVSSTDNQRLQVSGVSLNEEMANMLQYQQLYQAAAKLMNVINEIYNTTINGII